MVNEYLLERFVGGICQRTQKTVTKFTGRGNTRILYRINNQVALHCAITPKKEGGHFVSIGSAIRK